MTVLSNLRVGKFSWACEPKIPVDSEYDVSQVETTN